MRLDPSETSNPTCSVKYCTNGPPCDVGCFDAYLKSILFCGSLVEQKCFGGKNTSTSAS